MENAKTWIIYNTLTGSKRPWEVYFQVGNFPVRFIASCTSEEAAKESLKSLIKRCYGMYNVSQ